MAVDVFTRTEQAIWAALTGNATWALYVAAANRVNFTDETPNRIRDDVSTSDHPEFRLYPAGGSTVKRTSSGVGWVQRYNCQLFTGDQRSDRRLNPIKFITWAVIESTQTTLTGVSELVQMEFAEFADDMELAPETGRDAGWQTFGTITVELKFARSGLLTTVAALDPPSTIGVGN